MRTFTRVHIRTFCHAKNLGDGLELLEEIRILARLILCWRLGGKRTVQQKGKQREGMRHVRRQGKPIGLAGQ